MPSYKMDGSIANIAQQDEPLNLTLLIHRDVNELNGSIVYEIPNEESGTPALFNLTQQLKDITIEVKGSILDGNETHYWRAEITHRIVIDFETGLPSTSSTYRVSMFLRGGGELWTAILPFNHMHVDGFDMTLGTDLSVLKVLFHFDLNAASMVVEKATVKVGVIQNVRMWDPGNSTWNYPWWLNGTQMSVEDYNALVASWTDQYNQVDLSSSTIWSPRNSTA